MSDWGPALVNTVGVLVIPAAIVLGYFWRRDPLIGVAGTALLAVLTLWLVGASGALTPVLLAAAGVEPASLALTQAVYRLYVALVMLFVLLAVTWALALANTLQARHWWWLLALLPAGYLSLVLFAYSMLFSPDITCLFADVSQIVCPDGPALAYLRYPLMCAVGPGLTLVYAIWGRAGLSLRQLVPARVRPEGLSVAPLAAPLIDEMSDE
jgi:hypothetical protein